jgi:hypothetical protein
MIPSPRELWLVRPPDGPGPNAVVCVLEVGETRASIASTDSKIDVPTDRNLCEIAWWLRTETRPAL